MVIDTETMPMQQFPVAWSKLDFAELALTQHDFVFVIDADAVIMQSDIDIGILLNEMVDSAHSLAISPDINNVNSGIFVLRRSEWTAIFFAERCEKFGQCSRDKLSHCPSSTKITHFFTSLGCGRRIVSVCRE